MKKTITITTAIDLKTAENLYTTFAESFGTKVDATGTTANIEVENNLFRYTSCQEGDSVVEQISIDDETLASLIRVCGRTYMTIKPMFQAIKGVWNGWSDQMEAIIGKTKTVINGKERKLFPTRVTRRAAIDDGALRIRISARADSEEKAKEMVDGEFKKLGL